MKKSRNVIRNILLVLAMVMCVTGCAPEIVTVTEEVANQDESTQGESVYEVEVLRLEGGTDWGAPNPFLNSSRGPGTAKMKLVYASLLEKDETSDVSWLAQSWSYDGNYYTFTLYEGQTFHDGEALTTEDVAFTIDYYEEFTPITSYLGTGEDFIIEGYEIVDDLTIIIEVKEANADTLSNLGAFVIIPKHIWEDVEDPYSYTGDGYLVGSGAYTVGSYDGATGSYQFLAYEGWVNGIQATAEIQFVPVSDAVLAFENGEIDYTSLPADLSEMYTENEEIGLLEQANDTGYKMLINFEALPEFLDIELREAIYAAIDRQSIVDNVFRGNGTVGSAGYVPSTSAFYNEDVVSYEYDPEAALEVFGDMRLSVTLLASDSTDDLAVAEIIKFGLESAGVSVTVETYDSVTRDDKVLSGDYELAIVSNGGWGNNPPTYMATLFSDDLKYTATSPHYMGPWGYESEILTELAEAQAWETDFEARKEIFQEMQLIVSQEIPLIVLATESTYMMYYEDYYDGWMKTYAYQQASQNRLSYMSR